MRKIAAFAFLLLFLPVWVAAQIPPVGSLTVGTTAITNGTNGLCLYQNGTKLGEQACGAGTSANITVGTTTVTGAADGDILTRSAGNLGKLTPGTGVATALGVNVGSAGAFVANGGTLGTPSSGTLTNASGLPASGGLTGQVPVANGGTNSTTGLGAASALSHVYVQCLLGDASTASTSEAALLNCDFASLPAGAMVKIEMMLDTKSSTVACQFPVRISTGSGTGTSGTTIMSGASASLAANSTIVAVVFIKNESTSAQRVTTTTTPYVATTNPNGTPGITTTSAFTFRLNGLCPTGNGTTDIGHIRNATVLSMQTAAN